MMSSEKRKYELRARAERQAETRQRIAAAAAELHEEVGPAQTTVAEIARRAGVQRLTVYNNFPDDYQLFAACNQHFLVQHPPPDLSFAEGDDALERLEHLLRRLYGWYRETERMSTNVQRDRELVPALDALLRDTSDVQLAHLTDSLAGALVERGARRRHVRAAVALALDFWTWRRLAKEGLADRAAAELMSGAVRTAASGKGSPR